LHEIFRDGWPWAIEEMTKFWWRCGSPSGYRDCFFVLGDTESDSAAARSHSFMLIRQMAAVVIIKLHGADLKPIRQMAGLIGYSDTRKTCLGGGRHCPVLIVFDVFRIFR